MEITQSDRLAIRSLVERQLEAFQKDDAALAFSFASPGIQELFGTPEKFIEMVAKEYAAVYRPRSVIFESLTTIEGILTQPVLLLGEDGIPARALYLMEKQPSGEWRISGCFLVPVEQQDI